MSQSQKTVLVVEDDSAIRGLLALTLRSQDYKVATAESGEEALSQIAREQPDAIVLDMLLPGLPGDAVIASLSQWAGHIPIVTMSAGQRYTSVGESGVKAFLSKPFDIQTLMVVLDEVLH